VLAAVRLSEPVDPLDLLDPPPVHDGVSPTAVPVEPMP